MRPRVEWGDREKNILTCRARGMNWDWIMVGLPNESRDTIALDNRLSSPNDLNVTLVSSADPVAADDTAGEVVVEGVPSEASESAEEDDIMARRPNRVQYGEVNS